MTSLSTRIEGATVGARLGAAFGFMVLLLAACVAFGVFRLGALDGTVHSLLDHHAKGAELSARLVAQAHETGASLGRAVLLEKIDAIQAEIKHAEGVHVTALATANALADTLEDDAARALLKDVTAAEASYRTATDKVLTHIKGGDSDAARNALNESALRTAEAAYLGTLGKLDAHHEAAIEQARRDASVAYASGRNLLFGAAVLAVAMAVLMALWITRGIVNQLGAEPAAAAAVARCVAEGDLSLRIHVKPGDSSSVMAQLKAMQGNLVRLVSEVRQNSESVASASQQIAQGNQDLSQRTEEQASALQQTAASMEQLGSTVRQNAENARQGNQLAAGASTVAVKGGDVVGQVVQTMKGINDSSRKIADIIGVIDGIAFQTNILALNAAVEAARAGEQGRGFAVVASEVRNLAQRSAEAAKEIKSLIMASVERVEHGSALVDQAGTTMTEVVAAIRRVTDIMGEISAASTEQSTGVAQVGEAVSQMDRATQQNAALVEESAAAAESLKGQAQQLVQAVSVFKLMHGETA